MTANEILKMLDEGSLLEARWTSDERKHIFNGAVGARPNGRMEYPFARLISSLTVEGLRV